MIKKTILVCTTLFLSGCNEINQTEQEQTKETVELQEAADETVGMPVIENFSEKQFAKLIYELKDQKIKTYSYFMDNTGQLHLLCESVGYGLPASTQYVNPERAALVSRSDGYKVLPQPEPNGLFMPLQLTATYALCDDGNGNLQPVYSEADLIISPFKLKHVSSLK
ncbi:hypothetical protein [Endozoicomonas sp. Mp262]|uniref:hypothetical protein n=1 Tax=Endozoicomonas sp. Mp262 TaxID=2919499 RepID=UPI0021DA818F